MNKKGNFRKSMELVCFFVLFAVLSGLLIYQLDRAYFQLLGKPQEKVDGDENVVLRDLLQPGQIFLAQGLETNVEYARLTYSDGYYNQAYVTGSGLLQRVLDLGVWEQRKNIELPWERNHCVFVYDFDIGSEFLALMAGQVVDATDLHVGEIWIFPSATYREDTEIYLVNWQENTSWKISLGRTEGRAEAQPLLRFLYDKAAKMEKAWICVQNSLPGKFEDNAFVMKEQEAISVYPVELTSPVLRQNGYLDKEEVETYCQRFFENPDMMLEFQSTREQITYIDERATIQVSRNGLVQYTASYIAEEIERSLQRDFQTACAFLEKDMAMISETVPEYRLVGYHATEKGYVFCFDYYFNGIRFVLGEEFLKKQNLQSAIEIEVRNGMIRAYRCLPVQKRVDVDWIEILEETWVQAVDRLWSPGESLPQLIYRWSEGVLYTSWVLPAQEGEETA